MHQSPCSISVPLAGILSGVPMTTRAELERLRAELLSERKWREDLQALSIDQAMEIQRLRESLDALGKNASTEGDRTFARQALRGN
jgi:hypothetical protein